MKYDHVTNTEKPKTRLNTQPKCNSDPADPPSNPLYHTLEEPNSEQKTGHSKVREIEESCLNLAWTVYILENLCIFSKEIELQCMQADYTSLKINKKFDKVSYCVKRLSTILERL